MTRPIETSPSGKYTLSISDVATEPGYFGHTKGEVKLASGELLATVNRNYCSFPFLWIEDHPNGHDYIIAGEDYQGQTVIELDTGKRVDFLPEDAKEGFGFCMAVPTFNREAQVLVIDGCIWAAPYENRFYDFSDPMNGWPQIEIKDGYAEASASPPLFRPDGLIVCSETRRVGKHKVSWHTEHASGDLPGVYATEGEAEAAGAAWKQEMVAADDYPAEAEAEYAYEVNEIESGETFEVIATTTYRREGLTLVQVASWVDPEEQVRRDEQKVRQTAYDAAWTEYKATDPLYLRVKEHVATGVLHREDTYMGVGQCYEGWCPHFKGEDGRITLHLVEKVALPGGGTLSVDLEWGRTVAPVKLVIFKDGKQDAVLWFEHAVEGINKAVEHTLNLLVP